MQFIDLKKQYEVLKKEIDASVAAVLAEAHYIGGEQVGKLERELADYCGAAHCLTCANGTDALTLALRCLGVGAGDAVFVPSFTFFATAEVVALEGATPIFVDSDAKSFNIDVGKLEESIKSVIAENKYSPKAVIAVDLFGLPADYVNIKKITDKYGLLLIEDGAQGFGGSIGGKRACSFGDISTTSFFPAKPLGCYGDGGAIFTDNDDYYDLMKSLAVHGKGDYKYDNVRIGYNSRLDTLQAAILSEKLDSFIKFELRARNEIADRYTDALRGVIDVPEIGEGFTSSWAQYTLTAQSRESRDSAMNYLKGKGIPTMVYYPKPMHKQTAFADYKSDYCDLSVCERLSDTVFSIPMHPYLDISDQKFIIENIKAFFGGR